MTLGPKVWPSALPSRLKFSWLGRALPCFWPFACFQEVSRKFLEISRKFTDNYQKFVEFSRKFLFPLAVLGLCGRSRAALVASPGGLGRSSGPRCDQEQPKSGQAIQERPPERPRSCQDHPKTGPRAISRNSPPALARWCRPWVVSEPEGARFWAKTPTHAQAF